MCDLWLMGCFLISILTCPASITDYNVVISVLSMFILLVKAVMFVMNTFSK